MRVVSTALIVLTLLALPAEGAGDAEALRAALGKLLAAGDYAGALRRADAMIAEDGDSVVAWPYRAYALHQLGRASEAQRAYERTIRLDPENWWAHMNLGSLLASRERWGEAVTAATRATTLRPDSRDAWARLVRIHRDRLAFASASRTAEAALAAGIDPVWCHVELADLAWIGSDLEKAAALWTRAEELGADAKTVAHGRRLVRQDREMRRTAAPPLSTEWVISVGQIEVRTRVGPRLPKAIETLLLDVQRDHARLLGVRGEWPFEVRLRLSRTLEEHEIHRRREYAHGHRGAAFHVDRRWRSDGVPRRESRAGRFEIYVSWSEPGLVRRLSHEVLHSVLRMRLPAATDLPLWLDEGLATYVERMPDARGRLRGGTVRRNLLRDLRAARAAGETPALERLLGLRYGEFRGSRSRTHYAQSWALVHYLLEKGGGRGKLGRYLDGLNQRRARPVAEFRKVYGDDLTALDARFWAYVEKL